MLNVLPCIRRTFCQLSLLYGYKIVTIFTKELHIVALE